MNILEYVKQLKKRFTKTDVNSAIGDHSRINKHHNPLLADKVAWLVKNDSDVTSVYRSDRDSIMTDFARVWLFT